MPPTSFLPAQYGDLQVATGGGGFGADFSIVVPNLTPGEIWQLMSFKYQVATDATVATRRAGWRAVEIGSGRTSYQQYAVITQGATLGWQYVFSPACANATSVAGTRAAQTLPVAVWLLPGAQLWTDVGNVQGGDIVSALSATFQRWKI